MSNHTTSVSQNVGPLNTVKAANRPITGRCSSVVVGEYADKTIVLDVHHTFTKSKDGRSFVGVYLGDVKAVRLDGAVVLERAGEGGPCHQAFWSMGSLPRPWFKSRAEAVDATGRRTGVLHLMQAPGDATADDAQAWVDELLHDVKDRFAAIDVICHTSLQAAEARAAEAASRKQAEDAARAANAAEVASLTEESNRIGSGAYCYQAVYVLNDVGAARMQLEQDQLLPKFLKDAGSAAKRAEYRCKPRSCVIVYCDTLKK